MQDSLQTIIETVRNCKGLLRKRPIKEIYEKAGDDGPIRESAAQLRGRHSRYSVAGWLFTPGRRWNDDRTIGE